MQHESGSFQQAKNGTDLGREVLQKKIDANVMQEPSQPALIDMADCGCLGTTVPHSALRLGSTQNPSGSGPAIWHAEPSIHASGLHGRSAVLCGGAGMRLITANSGWSGPEQALPIMDPARPAGMAMGGAQQPHLMPWPQQRTAQWAFGHAASATVALPPPSPLNYLSLGSGILRAGSWGSSIHSARLVEGGEGRLWTMGPSPLHPLQHQPMGCRIWAGTGGGCSGGYLALAAVGGRGVPPWLPGQVPPPPHPPPPSHPPPPLHLPQRHQPVPPDLSVRPF